MSFDSQDVLHLLAATRNADGAAARRFTLLNRTREHVPYHAAVLCQDGELLGHSGASRMDTLGPYAQWLQRVARERAHQPGTFEAADLPAALGSAWNEWWPPYALSLAAAQGRQLLLVRELPWTAAEADALHEWFDTWQLAEQAADAQAPRRVVDFQLLRRRLREVRLRRKTGLALAAVALLLALPVKLTVRAPGEIVPREPTVLRASVDGMARRLLVEPNQAVQSGQLLAELDDAAAASRLLVARQALATAEAEWRQTMQQALDDPRAKAQLAVTQGRMEEKRTEVAYLSDQVRRTEVRAPHDGVVLVDDPGNWAGRTVTAGEPLLRLAKPDDQEVEAWLPVADAVELGDGSPLKLFLASRPASPVQASLRLYAFEASQRPEGGLAYRLRASLAGAPTERLGARGTAHVDGPRVPLVYWVLRRPLAALREATGW
ncbi:efflux RND transporter periplasmic adaptor subunit [Azohydromonas lata]|uniref:HlyD family efflux transporter periplasmic adaptor subunit n=1 Tax=Azohydromonas lata TaxID=45677 RepID=A0ABU5IQ11_9BURK|nr:HlyD family efflux transporter periplasmic adaptor subunit [Azohydromonas lata]MDZ5460968.1 HlyD family efflux transporter periplasmic adaptor subunit [Azohydromonas lata]